MLQRSSAPDEGLLRRRSTRKGKLAALKALLVAPFAWALFAACHTPSEDVDAGDLQGVFSHDAGAHDAAVDGGKRASKKTKDAGAPLAAASGSASAGVRVRAPVAGSCASAEGEPSRDVKRTVGRPACREAQVLEWRDAFGSPRYACVFSPRGVEARAPLPVVLFFHDGIEDPTMVSKRTTLTKLMGSFDLTGDPAHLGFVVLAVQGREIQGGKHGAAFDVDFTGEGNVDVAAVDHFLGELEQKQIVDKRRLYALGSSTGGRMAELYAAMRPDRVAAFGAFAAEPIAAHWACGGPPPPAVVLYRACDAFVPCSGVENWLHARDDAHAETAWVRLGAGNEQETNCALKKQCSEVKGQANHRRWPKGREEDFLKFFAKHALGPSASPAEADAGAPDEEEP